MKILKSTAIALLFSATFIACKKENDEIISSPVTTAGFAIPANDNVIIGTWVGEYSTNPKLPPAFLSFKLRNGNVLDLLDQSRQVIGTGRWTLDGSAFKATYVVSATQLSYSVRGRLSTSPEVLNGDWYSNQPYEQNGIWHMYKVK
jgi:hypothetical protein